MQRNAGEDSYDWIGEGTAWAIFAGIESPIPLRSYGTEYRFGRNAAGVYLQALQLYHSHRPTIHKEVLYMAIDRENPRNAIKTINRAADLIASVPYP